MKKKHKHDICCASHLLPMLNPARAKHTVRQVIRMVRALNLKFDAIACRGVSGLLIAPIVAMRLNKTIIVVRKGEQTHSMQAVEGDHGAKRYLILDDFIDGGDTVRAIVQSIYDVNKKARCAGFIAYRRLSFQEDFYEEPFELQMRHAWWDQETTYIPRFFPAGYVAAVEEEKTVCDSLTS
jgi:adenine/guanine phosphoribosyltransferase-like PRPP-binding protein